MNSKNSIILVDPDFDVDSAGDCDLLIKVTADNFSYAIIDGSENRLVVLYDHQECTDVVGTLTAQIENEQYLSIPFRSVKASVYTRNAIAIPNDFFDADQLNTYAKFFSIRQADRLHLQRLEGRDFTSIFNLTNPLESVFENRFASGKIFDHTAPLLSLSKKATGKQLTLDFTVGSFNAMLTEGQDLIFQNCYETEDLEEFNYYLLLMIHQLRLDRAATTVFLSGIIHDGDKKFEAIKQYFSKVEFNVHQANKLDVAILEDMPDQYYSSLLALQSCE